MSEGKRVISKIPIHCWADGNPIGEGPAGRFGGYIQCDPYCGLNHGVRPDMVEEVNVFYTPNGKPK